MLGKRKREEVPQLPFGVDATVLEYVLVNERDEPGRLSTLRCVSKRWRQALDALTLERYVVIGFGTDFPCFIKATVQIAISLRLQISDESIRVVDNYRFYHVTGEYTLDPPLVPSGVITTINGASLARVLNHKYTDDVEIAVTLLKYKHLSCLLIKCEDRSGTVEWLAEEPVSGQRLGRFDADAIREQYNYRLVVDKEDFPLHLGHDGGEEWTLTYISVQDASEERGFLKLNIITDLKNGKRNRECTHYGEAPVEPVADGKFYFMTAGAFLIFLLPSGLVRSCPGSLSLLLSPRTCTNRTSENACWLRVSDRFTIEYMFSVAPSW